MTSGSKAFLSKERAFPSARALGSLRHAGDTTGGCSGLHGPGPEGLAEYHSVMIQNGSRLQSQVCDTQVIVVRTAESLDDLRAGGAPMIPIDAQRGDGTFYRSIEALRRLNAAG